MNKSSNMRAKFDWMVLKPLWLLFVALAVYYFLQRAWIIGGSMLVMDFLLGIIAASLHKEKSFRELKEGQPSYKEAFDSVNFKPSNEELFSVSTSLIKLGCIFFIASMILTMHYSMEWYYAIVLSALISFLGPIVLAIPFFVVLARSGSKYR